MKDRNSFLMALSYTGSGNALRYSFAYFKRNKFATIITLLVLGGALALPTTFGLFVLNLKQINLSEDNANSLTLYLHTHVTDLSGAELAAKIQSLTDIRFTRYVSKDEALDTFRKQFTLADAIDTLDENPLPGAIIAEMATDDDDEIRIKLLSQQLQNYDEIELVKYDLRWLKRLNAIISLTSRAVIIIGAMLILTALLVVGNTIRLEMSTRSDEIAVSHLVGATRWQLKRPFLFSGLIYGFFGGVVAMIMVASVIFSLSTPTREISSLYGSQLQIQGISGTNFVSLLLISCLIGVLGAWIAAKLQISKIMTQQS